MKKLYILFLMFLFLGVAFGGDKLVGSYPRYKLVTFDGKAFSSVSLRGSAVFLTFFARACKPCEREVPFLNELSQKYKGYLLVLAVPFMEKEEAIPQLVKLWNITYPVCIDNDGSIAKAFNVSVLPRGFLVDHRGMIVSDYKGLTEKDKADIINRLNLFIPLIQSYRKTGPSFFVKTFEERTSEASGLGGQWATKITEWLKEEGAVVEREEQRGDYIIGGEVSKIGKILGVVITISYGGMVEKSVSDRVIGTEDSRLRELFVETLRAIPYFPRK